MNIKLKIFFLLCFCTLFELTFSQIAEQQNDSEAGEKKNQKKDTVVFRMNAYNLIDGLSRKSAVKLDTMINDFHTYNPIFKNSISTQDLGNLGSSYQSNDFFQRTSNPEDFLFVQHYKLYGIWPNNIRFYNNTKPFTLLEYGQWFNNKPQGETWLKVLHTQNITPYLNFGFSYNSITSQGKYLLQEEKDNNLHFFLSYNIDRYDLWFVVGKNKFSNQENGGLPIPEAIENPDLKPENIPVWLNGANNVTKNFFAILSHEFKLGKWKEMQEKGEIFQKFIPRFALMHTFEFYDNSRFFSEIDPNPYFQYEDSRGKVYFYGEGHIPYINGNMGSETSPATQDNSGQQRITNKFFIKAIEAPDRKYTFGKQAYIGNDIISVDYPREKLIFTPGIWLPPLGLTQSANYTNTYIGGSAFRSEGKFWTWDVTGRYYVLGYKFGDFDLRGKIEKPIRTARDTSLLRLSASMTNTTPDYFYDHYYSNHYKWENNFKKTYELRLGAVYDNPGWKFKTGFRYSIITNYIFWSEQIVPDQASSEFSVLQVFLDKDFKLGPLHIDNKLIYQKTTTERYLHVPQIMARSSIYLSGILSKVLHFQFGLDTRYESKFYGDYYSPALGMFYVQGNEQIGNYPWMDVFADLKIKRLRFYVKYSNIGESLFKKGYYTTPNYAAQIALLGFGLSWTFYD
jgi:hypothetical protein